MGVERGNSTLRGLSRSLPLVVAAASLVSAAVAQVCSGTVARASDVPQLRHNLTSCEEVHVVWQGSVQLEEAIAVDSSVLLNVTGAEGQRAVVDGGGTTRLFAVDTGSLLYLRNLALTGGYDSLYGGAVYLGNGSRATMESCIFTNNSAVYGGGIIVFNGSTATLESCAFTKNSATLGGGILVLSGGFLTVESCAFYENSAADKGGGVAVGVRSTATMESCNFTENSAESGGGVVVDGSNATLESCAFTDNSATFGGGIFVLGDSFLTAESCAFYENSAAGTGGGVAVRDRSTATMESCTFTDNSAESGGGVVVDLGGTAKMHSCTFTDNSAANSGGGVRIDRVSTVTMESCTFTDNSVTTTGGGVYIGAGSTVTMESCAFTNNLAASGGGVRVEGEGITATFESCAFTDNSAVYGGGLYVDGSSNATMESCAFTNNSVTTSGGGVYIGVGRSTTTMESCAFTDNSAVYGGGVFIVWEGSTATMESCAFTNNSAVNNGGGIAVSEGSTATMESCDFTDNSAAVWAGGGVWVGGEGSTATMISCAFTDNSAAAFGGGVWVGGKGSTAVMDRCAFIDNSATSGGSASGGGGGGAVFVGEGSSATMELCDFTDNSAAYGGGVTVVQGSATMGSCAFNDNSAVVSGGGVYIEGEGNTAMMESCAFTNNSAAVSGGGVFLLGTALQSVVNTSYSGSRAVCCHPSSATWDGSCVDVDGTTDLAREPCCSKHEYTDGEGCLPCDGAYFICDSLGITPTSLELAKGFWRADLAILVIRPCWEPSACSGGVATESVDEYCSNGYQGPYCAVCRSGYSSGVAYECIPCGASTKAGVAVAICLACTCVICAAWYLVSDLLAIGDFADASSEAKGPLRGAFKTLKRIPFGTMRIPIVVFQILTQYVSITGVRFPPLYQNFLAWVNVVNLDMGWVLSVGCLVTFDFYDRLLFATLAPLAVLVLLGCSYGFARRRLLCPRPAIGPLRSVWSASSNRRDLLEAIRQKHVSLAMVVSFLIYSTVSTAVFQTFACDTFSAEEGGGSYLSADYSLSCKEDKHYYYEMYAGIMIVVYPVGIPAVYSFALWRQRGHFEPGGPAFLSESAKALVPKGHTLRSTGFLWRPYKESLFWWELVECARRLCLTGFLVFIMPGTGGQAAVACIFSVLSLTVFAHSAPLKDRADTHIYIVGCAIIFLSTFLALLIKVDVSNENAQSQHVISVLLIVLNVGMAIAAIFQCALIARTSFVLAKENSVYGLRLARHSTEGRGGDASCEEKDAPRS